MPLILDPRLLVIGLGAAIGPLETSVNVAFPSMAEAFGIPIEATRWIVIGFLLTSASLMLTAGRLGDLFGYRRMFRIGLVLSIAALITAALAPSFGWLLVARVGQGAGAAILLGTGPALAIGLFPEHRRGPAISAYTTLFALGAALGPIIGGWLIAAFDWPGVFWFRVPLALAALAGSLLLPPPNLPEGGRFDFTGAGLLGLTIAALFLALNFAAPHPWPALALAAVAIAAGAAFVVQQRASPTPILRLEYFARPRFSGLVAGSILVNLAAFSTMLMTPFHLSGRAHLGPATAGLVFSAFPVAFVVGAWLVGVVIGRVRDGGRAARAMIRIGALGVAVELAWIATWTAATGSLEAFAAMALGGGCLGMFLPSVMFIFTGTLPPEDRGVAGSLSEITRTAGAVGAASVMFELFRVRQAAAGFDAAFAEVFWVSAALAAAVLAVMLAAMLTDRVRSPAPGP